MYILRHNLDSGSGAVYIKEIADLSQVLFILFNSLIFNLQVSSFLFVLFCCHFLGNLKVVHKLYNY